MTKTIIRHLPVLFLSNFVLATGFPTAVGSREILCDPQVPSRPLPSPKATLKMSQVCEEGQYLNGHQCVPCEDNTFMTSWMAQLRLFRKCLPCNQPGESEIISEACTKTRDSVIMCQIGFYRKRSLEFPCVSLCVICSSCETGEYLYKEFTGRECKDYNNTICCSEENMDVVDDICVKKSTTTSSQMVDFKAFHPLLKEISAKSTMGTVLRSRHLYLYLLITLEYISVS